MNARLAPTESMQVSDAIARTLGAVALAALAVIHLVDLPDTLGPRPLVGIGYLGLIASSLGLGAVLIVRSNRLIWAALAGLGAAAMGGYVLTRSVSGFLGDHDDVGNWRCPLGLAALSVETVLILLAVWQGARPAADATARSLEPAAREAPESGDARDYSRLA